MLELILPKLADPVERLSHRLLRTLSGLRPEELRELADAWPRIEVTRRRRIAAALVEMAEDDAEMDFDEVFRLLLFDRDEEVRATAASGLWECGDERLIDPLITLLEKDPSSRVRAAVAETLAHFAMLGAEGKLHGGRADRLRAALLHSWHDKDNRLNTEMVRRNVLESLAYFSDDEAVIAAIQQAYEEPSVTLRAGALSAMGITFDPRWHNFVLKELHNPEPELRFEAARAAGALELDEAVPRLIEMVLDPDQEVRSMAIAALGSIGGNAAKTALKSLLQSPDESIQEAAEDALMELEFNENPLNFNRLLERFRGMEDLKDEEENGN